TGVGSITLTGAATGITINAGGGTEVLTALGPGATITQNAGVGSNALVLGSTQKTIIDLGTTTGGAFGRIIIGGGTNPGQITFTVADSAIQIGASPTLTTAYSAATKIGGVAWSSKSVSIYTDNTTVGTSGPGKFTGLKNSGSENIIGNNSSTNTIYIDSTQDVE
ncbi:hypothetical protein LQZ21_07450, partial [Treponema sp. TIM-1]|uniref:hypothetical protein n=1 Tax=Treponema sp. TIM-1 TaxID=2898417 RepID=UPI00397F2462